MANHLHPAPLAFGAPPMLPAFAPGVAPSFPAPPPLPPPPMPPLPPQPFALPPPLPPPSWRGLANFVNRRPSGPDLIAYSETCNAVQRDGVICPKLAAISPKNSLPVCKTHKKTRMTVGHCKAIIAGRLCNQLLKWKPPFFELCDAHRDWPGMECHLMRLPAELRMQIFRYLLPDQPISAWLDRSLRSDGYKCTTSLLLVNKEIHREASDVLYRTQPFTVSIQRNSLNMAGRSYYHDLSGSQITTPNPYPGRLPVRPPMLDRIRSVRIQMTMIKPSVRPHRRGRLRNSWDEEVEAYDLRDSVLSFVNMLEQGNSLHAMSLVFCTQNQVQDWDDERQFGFLKLVVDPFKQLRDIPRIDLKPIYYCTDNLRMNTTQYILDYLRPRPPLPPTSLATTAINFPSVQIISTSQTTTDATPSHTHFYLSNCFDTFGTGSQHPPLLNVSKCLHDNAEFLAYKASWQSEIASTNPPPPSQRTADSIYKAFRSAYHAVDTFYFTKLPKGRDWMLHQARVAREKGDTQAIHSLRQELEEKVKGFVELDRLQFESKKNELESGFRRFDQTVANKEEMDRLLQDMEMDSSLESDDDDF